jgi:hypothetical protein
LIPSIEYGQEEKDITFSSCFFALFSKKSISLYFSGKILRSVVYDRANKDDSSYEEELLDNE